MAQKLESKDKRIVAVAFTALLAKIKHFRQSQYGGILVNQNIIFVSDLGGEFINEHLKRLLKSNGADIFHVGSSWKAGMVERCVRWAVSTM